MIEENLFKKYFPDFQKIIVFGFVKENDYYKYCEKILNELFLVEVYVFDNGEVKGKIIDLDSGELYTNFRVAENTGEFVGKVKDEFESILINIRDNCFSKNFFVSNQANRIAKLIDEKYGDVPIFKWEKYPDFGVFENKSSKKWYAIIMNISKNKLVDEKGYFDILNVKIDSSKIPILLAKSGIYPAYHMNKKYWISISLDDTLSDKEIVELIDESYQYSVKK